jgi:uncharacterized cysteine cluster protein YcgN (CxxCxxCC family)
MADLNSSRACGACSLCCKLLPIAELDKPHDRWCAHCRPGAGGCTIYETRPQACRTFNCLWLTEVTVADHWFPQKSKMVVQIVGVEDPSYDRFIDVHVDRGAADAWRRDPYATDLQQMSTRPRTLVRIFQGGRTFIVRPGETLEVKRA